MKRALLVLLTPLWLGLVFVLVFRFTFPSDALIERASFAVSDATNGSMALTMGGVHPTWMGLKAHDVVLSSVDSGVATPILAVESLRAASGLFSLISGSPGVGGNARFGEGRLDFDTTIAGDDGGRYDLRALDVDAEGFPVTALPPIQGTKILGTGDFDLSVDLAMPDGYAKSNGSATLSGENIELTGVSGDMNAIVTGFGILPATLERLDIDLMIREGKAEIRRGTLISTLADVTIEGDIVLTNRLSNSRFRLDLTIDAKEPLSGIKGMMSSALWTSDNRYHYELRGNFNRPSFQPARDRSQRTNRARPNPRDRVDREPDIKEEPEPQVDLPRGREETIERARAAREELARRVPNIDRRAARVIDPDLSTRVRDAPVLQGRDEPGEGDTAEPAVEIEDPAE